MAMKLLQSLSFSISMAGLVALGACGGTPPAENSPMASPTAASTAEATSQEQDVDYLTQLGLIKGHLLVAQELIEQGQPAQAEPHIAHPVEEIYANVEDQLQARQVQDFRPTLVQAEDLVKSRPNDPQLKTAVQDAIAAVDQAMEAVPAQQRQSPALTLQVMDGLLATAQEEYEAAIANGKIAEAIEYQDSRGFVLQAEDLYSQVASQINQANPEAGKAIQTNLSELKAAWPSVIPPQTPVMTPEQVAEKIEAIDTNAAKISG